MGLQQITKNLTMYDFLDRCVGRRVDRGALGVNVQMKNDFLAQFIECAEKHSGFGTHARKTQWWVKKPAHFLLHAREGNFV
jgi:hypothetical protein